MNIVYLDCNGMKQEQRKCLVDEALETSENRGMMVRNFKMREIKVRKGKEILSEDL
jgi:hypothetical protein